MHRVNLMYDCFDESVRFRTHAGFKQELPPLMFIGILKLSAILIFSENELIELNPHIVSVVALFYFFFNFLVSS